MAKKKVTKKGKDKKESCHTKPVDIKVKAKKIKKEKIDSMELLYKLIHNVQVQKIHASLTIEDISLKPIIVNILKDSGVDYQENVFNNKILIRLVPSEEAFEKEINLEEIDKDFIFDITSL